MTPPEQDRRDHNPRREEDECVRCTQENKINEIHSAIVGTVGAEGMASTLRRVSEGHDDMRHVVYGNGKMGLVQTVAWMKWLITALGSGLGAITAKLLYDYVSKKG
jgi:hypothetical protein